jgi:hypothetical protein
MITCSGIVEARTGSYGAVRGLNTDSAHAQKRKKRNANT